MAAREAHMPTAACVQQVDAQLYGNRHHGFIRLLQMIPCHEGFIESPHPNLEPPDGGHRWKVFLKHFEHSGGTITVTTITAASISRCISSVLSAFCFHTS